VKPAATHAYFQVVLQFNLNIDEVDVASQVFDHWRKDTATPAYIEVQCDVWQHPAVLYALPGHASFSHADLTGVFETMGCF